MKTPNQCLHSNNFTMLVTTSNCISVCNACTKKHLIPLWVNKYITWQKHSRIETNSNVRMASEISQPSVHVLLTCSLYCISTNTDAEDFCRLLIWVVCLVNNNIVFVFFITAISTLLSFNCFNWNVNLATGYSFGRAYRGRLARVMAQ